MPVALTSQYIIRRDETVYRAPNHHPHNQISVYIQRLQMLIPTTIVTWNKLSINAIANIPFQIYLVIVIAYFIM